MEHESDNDTTSNWCARYSHQRIGTGTGFVWVLWHINLCKLFNAKSIFIQIISSISNNSV